MIRLGIDLGGTKTEIIALDDRGTEILRRREATPADDYAATIELIARMIRETEIEIGKRGSIGIGTPGTLSPVTQRMRNSTPRSTFAISSALARTGPGRMNRVALPIDLSANIRTNIS